MSALAPTLLQVVVWAAVAEFLLLRVFLRVGPFLPAEEALLPLYRTVETLGLAAMNLAMLAGAGLIAAYASALAWRRPADALLGALLLAALLGNLGLSAPLGMAAAPAAAAVQAATMLAVLALGLGSSVWAPWRAALALAALAQAAALYHVLAPALGALGLALPAGETPAFAAEALAVAAALALPWGLGGALRRRHVALGLGLGLLLLVAHMARPWTLATIAMWTVAFTLFLPGALYAAALAAATSAALALRGSPSASARQAAAGVLLIALGGLRLDFSYFALLGLVGLLVATRALPLSHPLPLPMAQGAPPHPGKDSQRGEVPLHTPLV
ncbi:MAG: hypothetical protein HYU88_10970 [Chloroflexi bacterium]|nr:hypothetical protein [Chloroflexota bacterium]